MGDRGTLVVVRLLDVDVVVVVVVRGGRGAGAVPAGGAVGCAGDDCGATDPARVDWVVDCSLAVDASGAGSSRSTARLRARVVVFVVLVMVVVVVLLPLLPPLSKARFARALLDEE